MLTDRYDNPLATSSAATRDAYVAAVDRLLGAEPGMCAAFEDVVAAEPDFVLGHSGLARARQIVGDMAGARDAMATARARAEAQAGGLSAKDASHLHALGLLIDGKAAEAYPAIRAHVDLYPRDVLIAQTCTSVFGLIGFSGQPGRESELLAYTTALTPHYGEDWWFLSQHAFSHCETGRVGPADSLIERALALRPRNAHAAHIRAHIYYEAGEPEAGVAFLEGWLPDYAADGLMHCHISWHLALWLLGKGDVDGMWRLVDGNIAPGAARTQPLIVLSDNAAILYRAELAGVDVPAERWRTVSAYAREAFPKTGVAFADVHAALAHAMAGDGEALAAVIAEARGPAGDVVRDSAEAFQAIARQDWTTAAACLTTAMADHARIGGSRAQRDLLEHSLLAALLKLGRAEEARRLLAIRRPVQSARPPVQGLAA